jgi:hypothetical protein
MLSSQSPPAVAKKLKNGATWVIRCLCLQPFADEAGALLEIGWQDTCPFYSGSLAIAMRRASSRAE